MVVGLGIQGKPGNRHDKKKLANSRVPSLEQKDLCDPCRTHLRLVYEANPLSFLAEKVSNHLQDEQSSPRASPCKCFTNVMFSLSQVILQKKGKSTHSTYVNRQGAEGARELSRYSI